jgi:ATP-dependent DNA helicase RecG
MLIMESPVDKLKKFLKLEINRKFTNQAIIGGLEKVAPIWEAEAHSANLPEAMIQKVNEIMLQYPSLDVQKRQEAIDQIFGLLNGGLQTPEPEESKVPTGNMAANVQHDNIPEQNTVTADDIKKPTHTPAAHTAPPRHANARPPVQSSSVGLRSPLTVLPGVGAKTAEALNSLGLLTLEDLLYYFPRRYDDYSQLKPINRLVYGEDITVIATVESTTPRSIRGGQGSITEIVVSDGTGFLRLTYFNSPWMNNKFAAGDHVVISGKVDMYLGRLVMNNPDIEALEQEHLHTNRIVPVYSLTGRVTQKWLRKTMFQTVNFWSAKVVDFLPQSIKDEANLINLQAALRQVHFPDSNETLQSSRDRLAFDEIFLLQLGVLQQKYGWQSNSAQKFTADSSWIDPLIASLPFTLTNAQRQALSDVQTDLASGKPMNRLLQGDVGSGKTIIAALAAAIVVKSGAQVALMAPTGILADQHYHTFLKLLAPDDGQQQVLKPEEIYLLVGATPEAEKARIRAGLEDGSIKLVIGTHALIEDPVTFKWLQLAVVDEQHRFGVAQRAELRSKGSNPHLLVMTATPIPRTLALTVYGDLDLSVMDEMPAGRQPVETHVLHPLERERAYQIIRSQVKQGFQAFIIYPLIEKGEKDEARAAVDEHDRLQSEVFPDLKLGLIHGRLKAEEKDDVMNGFRNNEFNILVSTSVIEVGVDIPNATVMLIEGANRFGLAQLHQFRGRVGRGQAKAVCLLIPENDDALENERLAAMESTNDGFVLAEKDLQLRGPGEFLGTRQSGYSELKLASLTDVRLIEKARKVAQSLFERDPQLADPQLDLLNLTLSQFWNGGKGDAS